MTITSPKNRTDRIPGDLALVILLTLSCMLFVLIPPLNETPVRVVLGLLLVLFLPGYSLIAALFPGRDDLDGIEWIALRFQGSSIAVVPLLGLALNYTPFGIRLVPILVALSAFTVSLAVVACVRRQGLPEGDRFVVGVWGRRGWSGVSESGVDSLVMDFYYMQKRRVGWAWWVESTDITGFLDSAGVLA